MKKQKSSTPSKPVIPWAGGAIFTNVTNLAREVVEEVELPGGGMQKITKMVNPDVLAKARVISLPRHIEARNTGIPYTAVDIEVEVGRTQTLMGARNLGDGIARLEPNDVVTAHGSYRPAHSLPSGFTRQAAFFLTDDVILNGVAKIAGATRAQEQAEAVAATRPRRARRSNVSVATPIGDQVPAAAAAPAADDDGSVFPE